MASLVELERHQLAQQLGLTDAQAVKYSLADLQAQGFSLVTKPGRSISDSHADTSFSNSTANNTIASLTIPADAAVGDIYRFTVDGEIFNNTGAAVNYTFQVLLGATVLTTSSVFSANAASVPRHFRFDVDVQVVATNDERISIDLLIQGAGTDLSTGGTSGGTVRKTATEDLTVGKNLIVNCQMGTASALASITAHEAFLTSMKR